ncbi:hypothetical protein HPB50_010702 [Hyalomma asiaticum]|uniref:Uncharacterized protein n=1 Tax=Hyalomma asiaticum TaxID=266040 RepID=A0ACB7SFW2_HYAAI|nr:hypothetical protein HPB50_010702 [Hyalomma asiaticum]
MIGGPLLLIFERPTLGSEILSSAAAFTIEDPITRNGGATARDAVEAPDGRHTYALSLPSPPSFSSDDSRSPVVTDGRLVLEWPPKSIASAVQTLLVLARNQEQCQNFLDSAETTRDYRRCSVVFEVPYTPPSSLYSALCPRAQVRS